MNQPARDPGLARERTWLAWQRTAIVIAANGVLLLRSENALVAGCAFAVLVIATVIGVWSSSSLAERLSERRGPAFQGRWLNGGLFALAVLISVLDLGAVFAAQN